VVWRTAEQGKGIVLMMDLDNASMSPLFQAMIEVIEEAIISSLFMAETMTSRKGTTVEVLLLERVLPIL